MTGLLANIIGYAGAVFGMSIMVPQLVKSLKTKSVKDISIIMLFVFLVNCTLWVTYGLLIKSWPVVLSNQFGYIIVYLQFILKIKYNKK